MTNHNPWKFTSISPISPTPTIAIIMSSLPSNPLFSSIVTLYFLILLYFPHLFFKVVISPVLISTLIVLLSLLRLGASQQLKAHYDPNGVETIPLLEPEPEPITVLDQGSVGVEPTQQEAEVEPHCNRVETQQSVEPGPGTRPEPILFDQSKEQIDSQLEEETGYGLEVEPEPEKREPDPQCHYLDHPEPGPNPVYKKFFVEWDVGAPLEVIYEAYEGEEDEDKDQNDAFDQENSTAGIKRYPSLSRYYPESDSDSDSDKWDEEEREELIEIALDYHGNNKQGMVKLMEVVHVDDEDNLIEIDISPTRSNFGFSW